ncbi:MAG TPA: acyltransferase [Chloroflexia bacterium]|nr:acyltransferase [Chloroflexia bacterium]
MGGFVPGHDTPALLMMEDLVGLAPGVRVHPSADVSAEAEIGADCRIWHEAQVREGARLGANCIVGKGAYVDFGVQIGCNVKIQNRASIYHGVTLEDGVFIGPHVIFTNDKLPRAINPNGSLKSDADWVVGATRVRYGAAVGAGAVVLPDVTIGRFAMVGAAAVVTHDVPDYGLVLGHPARLVGFVCACGTRLPGGTDPGPNPICPQCGATVPLGEGV